jgi:hypothetical protein
VRFTAEEYADLTAAATRAGLTTTGYVGEAALAAARGVTTTGEVDTGGSSRAELAALQRDLSAARTAVSQAANCGGLPGSVSRWVAVHTTWYSCAVPIAAICERPVAAACR